MRTKPNILQALFTAAADGRRGPKIWIEGSKLAAAGGHCGAPYSLITKRDISGADKSISIIFGLFDFIADDFGTAGQVTIQKRHVSKAKRSGKDRPIIEIHNQQLAEIFPVGTRLKVVFQVGRITITEHHESRSKAEREQSFKDNIARGSITEASMFTGGAISTDAIHSAINASGVNSKLQWICEIEYKYIEAAGQNCLAVDNDTAFLVGAVEEIEREYYTQVDLLSFSMPCAGFSNAGKAKHKQSAEQHSGTALFGVVNAIQSANPAVLISENVVAAKDSPIYALLRAELERLGYRVFEQVLNQSHTGTIEQRCRYWLVAISEGIAPEAFQIPADKINTATVASILDLEVDPNLWADNDYLKSKAESDAAAGKGFKRQLLNGAETAIGTIGRFYNKKRSTEPFLIRDDGMERLLTPAEHARVKSIPVHLIADLPKTTAHEILGQSVDYLQPFNITSALFALFTGADNMGVCNV